MYREKYLKYKSKYLALKQLSLAQGGSINRVYQKGGKGEQVQVVPNTGAVAGTPFTNQCMWISILDYLLRRPAGSAPATPATLLALRTEAGLDASTQNTPFDSDTPAFMAAILRIAQRYNLRIEVYPVDNTGRVLYDVIQVINPGGANIVRIAQYGLNHFQLIIGGLHGVPLVAGPGFNPLLFVKGKLENAGAFSAEVKAAYSKKEELAQYRKDLIKIELQKAEQTKIHGEIEAQIAALYAEGGKIGAAGTHSAGMAAMVKYNAAEDLRPRLDEADTSLSRLEGARLNVLELIHENETAEAAWNIVISEHEKQ